MNLSVRHNRTFLCIVLAALFAALGPYSKADTGVFADDVLAAHNEYRAEVGVAPLTWSETLASEAQEWAETIAAEGRLRHSGSGENLAAGSSGAYSAVDLVQLWGSEKDSFIPGGTFPGGVSETGNWTDVGHYTQVVWSATTELGCGFASNGGLSYLVCRYNPPGNFIGEKPY